jgi:6-phosphogluconolactonase (cycloisomerase 2 family)
MKPHQQGPSAHKTTLLRRHAAALAVAALLALPVAGGVLSFLELFAEGDNAEGIAGASSVSLTSDGVHVYVAGSADDAVAIFRRDATAEALTFAGAVRDGVSGVFGLAGVSALASSGDGHLLAATGQLDDTVVLFRRDITNDGLVLTDVKQDGVGGVYGLESPSAVTFSPTHERVYVAGYESDSVAVFRRDVSQDALVFVEAQLGSAGVPGLTGPTSLAAAGDYLFVAARSADAVLMFQRNLGTGGLDWLDTFSFGGSCLPSAVATVPTGHPQLPSNMLWVACPGSGNLRWLWWSPSGLTGSGNYPIGPPEPGARWGLVQTADYLLLVGPSGSRVIVFGKVGIDFEPIDEVDVDDIPELLGAVGVAALPSGHTAWVVSFDSSALLSFKLPIFADGFEAGTTVGWSATVGD